MIKNTDASVPPAKCSKLFGLDDIVKRQGVYVPYTGAQARIVTIKRESCNVFSSWYITDQRIEPLAPEVWNSASFLEVDEDVSISFLPRCS